MTTPATKMRLPLCPWLDMEKPESAVARPMKIYAALISRSLVVYRLVHPPVTRESGVRLPAREASFFTFLFTDYAAPPFTVSP